MEKQKIVDQRCRRVLQFVSDHAESLARQGTVVEAFRSKGGKRTGPYCYLAFRESGRQRRIYLGAEERLVGEVRSLLERIQGPLRRRRFLQREKQRVRRSHRRHKAKWRDELAQIGLRLKGNEIRGSTRLALLRADWALGRAGCPEGDGHG